jgi:hypothetical protein
VRFAYLSRPGRPVQIFGYLAGRPDGRWVEAAIRG